MIKIFNCFTEKDKKKLELFLENRRSIDLKNVKKVNKIIEDIKRNKLKALLRYEKKFSKNKELKPSKAKIKNSIKKLNPKVKKAIDFAYERIVKFHAAQLKTLKDVKYIDNKQKRPKKSIIDMVSFLKEHLQQRTENGMNIFIHIFTLLYVDNFIF